MLSRLLYLQFLFGAVLWGGFAHARDIILDAPGDFLYTANHDAGSISKIALPGLGKAGEFALPVLPDNLVIDPQGRIWVTSRLDGRVLVLDAADGGVISELRIDGEPFDVLPISVDRVAVTVFKSNEILLIDTSSFALMDRIGVARAPRGLSLAPDGQRLFVTHFLSGSVTAIDVQTLEVDYVIQPEADGNLLQNLVFEPAGTRAYLPHTRSNNGNPNLFFDNTVFPVVSVINPVAGAPVHSERISLDIADRPVGLPIDIALTESHFFVLNAASNDVSVIDRETGIASAHIAVGDNPRSLAIAPDGAELFVHNSLSGSVSVIDTDAMRVIDEVTVSHNPLPPDILQGKVLFNSSDTTDLARDQWIACATCHFDGEMDGRTWAFPDGPRNTPSLVGVSETPPFHWSGNLDELHDVESTVRDVQAGSGLVPGDDHCSPTCDAGPPNEGRSGLLDSLVAYMASLKHRRNPNVSVGRGLSTAARRGSRLFHAPEQRCAECHTPPLYTDGQRHDVGTGGGDGEQRGSAFDTPSLRDVFSTGPYLHDGAATTLRSVMETHNPGDRHGVTSELTAEEIDDLVAFLKSIGLQIILFSDGFESRLD